MWRTVCAFVAGGISVVAFLFIIIIIIIRLYNTVGEENRVVREVNRDRLC